MKNQHDSESANQEGYDTTKSAEKACAPGIPLTFEKGKAHSVARDKHVPMKHSKLLEMHDVLACFLKISRAKKSTKKKKARKDEETITST